MRKSAKRAVLAMAAATAVGLAAAAGAADDDAAVVKYRQRVMQAQGAAMGAIGDILKNKLPHEKHLAEHARVLVMEAKLVPAAFDKAVKAGKTDAKPEIWEDFADFEKDSKKLVDEAEKLVAVAEKGDTKAIAAQVKEVGGACQHCHEEFRKPEKESYKSAE